MRIALAADVGEEAGSDDELLPLLDVANVCCGAHAGSPDVTVATVERCLELGVQIGAHPGYADRERFGRSELGLSAEAIRGLVAEQIAVIRQSVEPVFVKPHGALYHRCQTDAGAAAALADVATEFGLGLVGQPEFLILAAAAGAGVPAWREGYADRGYAPDGSLVARGAPGAVLGPEDAAEQALGLALSGDIDVICLHGDSPGAVDVARAVRARLQAAGVELGALSAPAR